MVSDKVLHLLFISVLIVILTSCAAGGPAADSGELQIQDIRPLEQCTENLLNPSAINYPETIDPDELEGNATVTMTITRRGTAEDIRVEKSTDSQLAETVVTELEQLNFKPSLCGDFPIPVQVTVPFAF